MRLDIQYYRWVALRRVWLFASIFLLLGGVAVLTVTNLPMTYSAQARILVESSQIPDDLAGPTVSVSNTEQLEVIENRVMTRDVLLSLIQDHGLTSDGDETQAIARLRENITFKTTTGRDSATILTVTVQHKDPATSHTVATDMANRILTESNRIQSDRVDETLAFYRQRVAEIKARVEHYTTTIAKFKSDNAAALPENLSYYIDRRAKLQDRLLEVETPVNSTARQNLEVLQEQLAQARAIYAPRHPKVKLLETQIDAAQESSATLGTRINPAAEKHAEIKSELLELNQSIARIPENKITLAALERELSLASQEYESAVTGLAQATTSERIEALEKGDKLTLVEAATFPLYPKGPNQSVLIGGGLLAAFFIAVGIIVILEKLDRTLRRPIDLEKGIGVTPFAVLPDLGPPVGQAHI